MNVIRYLDDHDISISHVLLTHWHGDHTGGIADLLAHNPNTQVHKHELGQGQRNIVNGQKFRTQGATLRAVLTPGHTTDHTCFVLEEANALFTGDNVLGHGFSVAEDLGAYMSSLHLMAGLGCAVGYPGHGAVIPYLPQKIAVYIAQRDFRTKLVYDALVRQAWPESSLVRHNRDAHGSDGSHSKEYESESSDQDGADIGTALGMSVTEICQALHPELSKDTDTLESALKPLLNPVLAMLVGHGKAAYRVGVEDNTKYWFAKIPNS